MHALCFVVSTQLVIFSGERRATEYMNTETDGGSSQQNKDRGVSAGNYRDIIKKGVKKETQE